MKDKYTMTQKENIFLAKRNIIDAIWKSANLEGINITFPETYAIYEKLKIQNVDIADVNTILNLKHGWQEVLSTINDALTLDYICRIHSEVSKDEALTWGKLRTGQVGISGTNYIPPLPDEMTIKTQLEEITQLEPNTNRCIRLMLYLMKAQIFWDGNKRTAMLIANKEMIKQGNGIISIPIEHIIEFNTLLSDYYTYDRDNTLIDFIYDKAIKGIDM
ncbi:Fic family protein [Peptoniphilus equinus]|uniref:Fic family protein n=1 Tax=Peptoniphilus equinus TaxID=3016343 RepID=A0ABY7QR93_9FIRM|nr:Fic family protein [Peptoniphilus equinus]WBW49307.1 Fic family protein [Peptoniphilus equinus]